MSQSQNTTPTREVGLPDVVSPVTESTKNEFFPEIDNDDWEPMADAPRWKNPQRGPDEERVFDAQYAHIVQQYYQEAVDSGLDGQTVLKMFTRWKPAVSAFVRACLRSDTLDNELGATLSPDPNGSNQAYLRALRTDALTNASYYQTPSATGQFNIFPDEGAGNDTFATPTSGEQGWLVIGLADYAAGGKVPYDTIQAELNDATGVRSEDYVRHQVQQPESMALVEFTGGPLPAYPNVGIDIDCDIYETGIEIGTWPIGFEVIVESASESGGVLGV